MKSLPSISAQIDEKIINKIFQKNYNQRIKDNIKTIKKLPKIKGVKEIMYPGQNKFNRYKQNLKKEITITEIIKKDLEYLKNF